METYSNKNFKEKNLEENIAICKEKAKVYNAFYSSSLNALYLFLQRIAIAVVSAMKNKSEIQAMAKKNGVRFNENKPETPVLQLTYMDILKTLSDEERKKQIGKMYKWATALKTARESGIKAEDICEHLEKNGISQKKNPTKKDDKHVSDNRGTSSGKKCPSKKSEKNSFSKTPAKLRPKNGKGNASSKSDERSEQSSKYTKKCRERRAKNLKFEAEHYSTHEKLTKKQELKIRLKILDYFEGRA